MTPSPFTIKAGDTRPFLRVQLVYADKSLPNLISSMSVTFKMRSRTTGEVVLETEAVVIISEKGIVEYQWVSGDTNTVDDYDVEWMVLWNDGREQTFPSEGFGFVRITERLG